MFDDLARVHPIGIKGAGIPKIEDYTRVHRDHSRRPIRIEVNRKYTAAHIVIARCHKYVYLAAGHQRRRQHCMCAPQPTANRRQHQTQLFPIAHGMTIHAWGWCLKSEHRAGSRHGHAPRSAPGEPIRGDACHRIPR